MSFISLIEPDITSHLTMVLLHALWQGLFVWLVLRIVLRLLQKRSAALRYGASVTGLWVMLFLPVLTWFLVDVDDAAVSMTAETGVNISVPEESLNAPNVPIDLTQIDSVWSLDEHETVTETESEFVEQQFDEAAYIPPAAAVKTSPTKAIDLTSLVVASLWVSGVLLLSVRLLMGYVWTLRVSFSRLPIDSDLQSRLKGIANSLGWKSMPRVFLSSRIKEAIVVGYLKPFVLIPITWTTQLTPEAIEAVIIHELTHIRRFDLWVILVQRIAETMLFFHPAVWLLSKRISYERELCCDAESARLLDSNLSYATALEQVARYLFEHSTPNPQIRQANILSPTFGGQKMELLARVQHVLSLSSNASRPAIKPRRHYHGITMLMIPAVLLGLGFSLVNAMEEEPPEPTANVDQSTSVPKDSEPETSSNSENEEANSDTGKLIFGVSSEFGILGEILFEDREKSNVPLLPTDVVAIVNGTKVTTDEVLEPFRTKLEQLSKRVTDEKYREAQDILLGKHLPIFIDEMVLSNAVIEKLTADQHEAVKNKLDEFFELEVERLKKQFHVADREALEEVLNKQSMSMESMEIRFAKRQLAQEYLRGKLSAFADDASSNREARTKQIIAELRKTSTIKTIFDDDWALNEPREPLLPNDIVAIVNGTSVEALDVLGTFIAHFSQKLQSSPPEMFNSVQDGLLKDQDRILKKHLPRHVDQLLLSSAYQARLSADELEEISRESDRIFEQKMERMKIKFGVDGAKEINAALAEIGMPPEWFKQKHKNHFFAQAYLSIELAKFNDNAKSNREEQTKQIIAELRKTSTIKTIFDDDWALNKPPRADNAVAIDSKKDDANKENGNPFAGLEFIETPDGPAIDISHEQFQKIRDRVELDGKNWHQVFEVAAFGGSTNEAFQQIRKLKGIVNLLGGKVTSMPGVRQEVLDNDPTKIRVTLLRNDMTVNILYGSDPVTFPEVLAKTEEDQKLPPFPNKIIQALAKLTVPFRLYLTKDTVTDESLEQLASNKQIVSITVQSKHVTDEGLRSLLRIPQLKQLEWITPCSASDLLEIVKHRSIESLMINAKYLDSESIKPLGQMTKLNRLSITLGNNLDSEFAETLVQLPDLETLQLQFVRFGANEIKKLRALKKLKSFELNPGLDAEWRLNDEAVRAVLLLPKLRGFTLRHVTLDSETITNTLPKSPLSYSQIYDCTVIDETGGRKTHDLIWIREKQLLPSNSHPVVKPTSQPSPWQRISPSKLEFEYTKLPPEWKDALNKGEQKAWDEVTQSGNQKTLQFHQPAGSKLQYARWGQMNLRGVDLQVDEDKQVVSVEKGLFQHSEKGVQKSLQADRIEVFYSQKQNQEENEPIRVQATGNVRYSYQLWPVPGTEPSLIRGDELTWDLVKNELEVRSKTQVIQLRQAKRGEAEAATLQKKNETPITEIEWNWKIFIAMQQVVDLEYVDATSEKVIEDLNKRYFGGRMELDFDSEKEAELNKGMRVTQTLSGITLRSALYLILGDLNLVPIFEDGKVKVITRRAEEKKRAERQLIIQKEIREKLQGRISINLVNKPLSQLCEQIATGMKFNIMVDEAGLSEEGLTSSTPITVQLENVRVSTMLSLLLKQLNLAYEIEDQVLKITSKERAFGELKVVLYQVAKLVVFSKEPKLSLERLSELMTSTISPSSWDKNGGRGHITHNESTLSLVIRQRPNVHQEIVGLLSQLRRLQKGEQPEPTTAPELPQSTPEEIETNQELKMLMSMDLKEVPLSEFFRLFRDKTGLQLHVNPNGLSETGLTLDTKVSFHVDGIMRQSVLKLVLDPIGLDYRVKENIIVISSKERTAGPLTTVLYPLKEFSIEENESAKFIERLVKVIAPETWEQKGGSGVASFNEKSKGLIIRQTAGVHKQVAVYLKMARNAGGADSR